MELKERIQWYLDRLDESNPADREKLQEIYDAIERIFVGLSVF